MKITQLLLERAADLHARTAWGWTPLETAEKANTTYTVKLLTEREAKGVYLAHEADGATRRGRSVGQKHAT